MESKLAGGKTRAKSRVVARMAIIPMSITGNSILGIVILPKFQFCKRKHSAIIKIPPKQAVRKPWRIAVKKLNNYINNPNLLETSLQTIYKVMKSNYHRLIFGLQHPPHQVQCIEKLSLSLRLPLNLQVNATSMLQFLNYFFSYPCRQ